MPARMTLPLELATFVVDDVVEADANAWADGRLHLDPGSFAGAVAEPALAAVQIEVVRPGDPVRIANVLDAVLPDVKADDPERTFPGALGGLALAGRGRTNRMEGVGVLSVCDWLASGYTGPEEFPDALVDMAGLGAEMTRWGRMVNVVVRCVPARGAPLGDVDRAVRRASLRVARDLSAITIGGDASRIERIERPRPDVDPRLPAIGAILQVASEAPLTDTFLYGHEVGGSSRRSWTRASCSTARSRTARTTGRPCATSPRATKTHR